MISVPTKGEKFAELIEHLIKAQEAAIVIGHLTADENKTHSAGWLGIGELLGRMRVQVTKLATRGYH